MPSKFLAYLAILCFEERRPKQKYGCSPKVKHFGLPQNFRLATPLMQTSCTGMRTVVMFERLIFYLIFSYLTRNS